MTEQYENVQISSESKNGKYICFSYKNNGKNCFIGTKKKTEKYFEMIYNMRKPLEGSDDFNIYPNGYIEQKGIQVFGNEKMKFLNFNGAIQSRDGYLYFFADEDTYAVCVNEEEPKDRRFIHREVAKAFVKNPNPELYTCVDHIDKNKKNNDVSNLRWVSRSLNQRNQKMSKNNKSGVKGVSFYKRNNAWKATWIDKQGKVASKQYSINKYGDVEAKQMAIKYRKKMELENNYMCSYSTINEYNEAKQKIG